MKTIGTSWRSGAMKDTRDVPSEVRRWWQIVLAARVLNIADIHINDELCNA